MVEEVVAGIHGATFWRENFRMSHDTLSILCEELRPHLERQTTKFRVPVSVEVRVAGTIWRLGTNVKLRILASLFGLGRSTVAVIFLDTCDAIMCHLLPLGISS